MRIIQIYSRLRELFSNLRVQFSDRFVDVQKYNFDFKLLAAPLDVYVDAAAELVKMELVDLQCNGFLK